MYFMKLFSEHVVTSISKVLVKYICIFTANFGATLEAVHHFIRSIHSVASVDTVNSEIFARVFILTKLRKCEVS